MFLFALPLPTPGCLEYGTRQLVTYTHHVATSLPKTTKEVSQAPVQGAWTSPSKCLQYLFWFLRFYLLTGGGG